MFFRVKPSGPRRYLQIVENRRVEGAVRQTVIATLGRLDEQLTRSGPEAFMRRFFGIDGRKHHEKINPFYRGSSGGGRLRAKAFDAEVGFEVELEFDGTQVRQSRQIVFIEQSGKIHHLPIPEKLRDPEKLLALYRGLGVTPPVQARIFYDPSESDLVLPLVQAAWPASSFNEMGPGGSSFSGAVTEFHVNHRYFRAYAKIGFHYFLTQFPQYDGSEACFADIRDFIGNDTAGNDQVNKFVARREVPLLAQMLYGARPDEWVGHLLCAEIRHGECLAHLQLSLHIEALHEDVLDDPESFFFDDLDHLELVAPAHLGEGQVTGRQMHRARCRFDHHRGPSFRR